MARSLIFIALTLSIALSAQVTTSNIVTINDQNNDWQNAHATFYGDMGGGETMRK